MLLARRKSLGQLEGGVSRIDAGRYHFGIVVKLILFHFHRLGLRLKSWTGPQPNSQPRAPPLNDPGLTTRSGLGKVRGLDSNQRLLGPEPSVLPLNYPGMCAIRWRSIE